MHDGIEIPDTCLHIRAAAVNLYKDEYMRLRKLKGQMRRIFHNYANQGYVAEQLEKRKGYCKQCGKCCALVFRCPFLNKESKCIIYHKGRPRHCTTFPLDRNDLRDIEGECGYYFD